MKKSKFSKQKHLIALLLFSATGTGMLNAQTTNPAPYCASEFDINYNMFNNIKIQGTQLNFGVVGTWMDENEYGFYNTFNFPALTRGGNATIELNVHAANDIEPIYYALWIDFNQNNAFENNEKVMSNANTTNAALPVLQDPVVPITKTIAIPANAVVGTTRARLVRGTNAANSFAPYDPSFSLSPCNSAGSGYGNTYDLKLQIADGNVGITTASASENVVFYPNPATENVYCNCGASGDFSQLSFRDALGRTVKTVEVSPELTTISLAGLPAGLYYVFADGENEKILLDKIVVQQ